VIAQLSGLRDTPTVSSLELMMVRNLVYSFLLLSVNVALGQSTATTPAQLQAVQAQARAALLGTAQPTTLVLNGTFTSIAGSLTQDGNVHLTVGSDGALLINLSGSSSSVSESRSVSSGVAACSWTDQESVVHNSSFLNCMPPAWFFPGLTLLTSSSSTTIPVWMPSSYFSDSLGNHLQFQFTLPNLNGASEDPQLLSPFDLVLAPSTMLPQYALFTVHPDNPGINADIPVEIAFSNYQSVAGVMVPFHVQRFVNGSLVLDLAIATASVQ
jgi:hypothetical protein